ncbi:unnamed protein product [Vitrella brassicaformis CCMP3155]|uniref:Ion transport domain-containing protein n=1 Tax=Vitrella brassicaformis (strain CCMP3155) TaxID=1169540 RepID=A0A0G4EGZ0_VITBC|nr:unnamed protein product [Vitrella brassicaformis CCMP3155]|eukprot:CEL94833.1 unnamed protein product [Vitrella brassicaformis CCMP3155]
MATLIIVFVILLGIILVNLLIAIMSSTYATIETTSDAQYQMLRIKVLNALVRQDEPKRAPSATLQYHRPGAASTSSPRVWHNTETESLNVSSQLFCMLYSFLYCVFWMPCWMLVMLYHLIVLHDLSAAVIPFVGPA